MAGRHRRTPAWRRLLLRLRRSDRAARTAALQAEVVALRATVGALQADLAAVREAAAAATALAQAAEASRWKLALPLVQVALAPAELDQTRVAAAATPVLAGLVSIKLDLGPDTATTQIVLPDSPAIVLAEAAVVVADLPAVVLADSAAVVLADLPESAMLDPRQARHVDADVAEPVMTASAADTILPVRRSA